MQTQLFISARQDLGVRLDSPHFTPGIAEVYLTTFSPVTPL